MGEIQVKIEKKIILIGEMFIVQIICKELKSSKKIQFISNKSQTGM